MGSIVSSENEGPTRWYKWSDGLWRDHSEPEQPTAPPLTPEEEEEAPEDREAICKSEQGCHRVVPCDPGCGASLPPPEGPEYTPCVCGHIEPEHDINGRWCAMEGCECSLYRTEPVDEEYRCLSCGGTDTYYDRSVCAEPCGGSHTRCGDCGAADGGCLNEAPPLPPQPERRAPYVATYSVGGHLYEVAVPGDASLQAVDGALVIRHGLGPVAGLVAFQPMTVEEQR